MSHEAALAMRAVMQEIAAAQVTRPRCDPTPGARPDRRLLPPRLLSSLAFCLTAARPPLALPLVGSASQPQGRGGGAGAPQAQPDDVGHLLGVQQRGRRDRIHGGADA
eukprot:7283535-Prymnesium_polylepis.1